MIIPSSINVKRKRYELVSEKTRKYHTIISLEGKEGALFVSLRRDKKKSHEEKVSSVLTFPTPLKKKIGRVTSPMSLESEEQEGEAADERPRNEHVSGNGARGNDMHDEDMDDEDTSQQHALKRRASTGTLLSQAKASVSTR